MLPLFFLSQPCSRVLDWHSTYITQFLSYTITMIDSAHWLCQRRVLHFEMVIAIIITRWKSKPTISAWTAWCDLNYFVYPCTGARHKVSIFATVFSCFGSILSSHRKPIWEFWQKGFASNGRHHIELKPIQTGNFSLGLYASPFQSQTVLRIIVRYSAHLKIKKKQTKSTLKKSKRLFRIQRVHYSSKECKSNHGTRLLQTYWISLLCICLQASFYSETILRVMNGKHFYAGFWEWLRRKGCI